MPLHKNHIAPLLDRLTINGYIGASILDLEVLDKVPVEFGLLRAIASIPMPITGVLPALFPIRRTSPLAAPGGSSRSGTGSQTSWSLVSYRCVGQRPTLRCHAPAISSLCVTLDWRVCPIGSTARPHA